MPSLSPELLSPDDGARLTTPTVELRWRHPLGTWSHSIFGGPSPFGRVEVRPVDGIGPSITRVLPVNRRALEETIAEAYPLQEGDLWPGKEYEWQVWAGSGWGSSPPSAWGLPSLVRRFTLGVGVSAARLFERDLGYRFQLHQHPYVGELVQRLLTKGTPALQAADTGELRGSSEFFEEAYKPNRDPDYPNVVQRPYPVKNLDFSSSGAYAVYNWELFFHAPLTIALHLSKNQRFAEAQRWFHYVWDPTDHSNGPTPERFWKVKPFQETPVRQLEDLLVNLAKGKDGDATLLEETLGSIEAWMKAPFRPHAVAGTRFQAYMYKTVMAYLDNLIAWGDSLFRQDSGEAIDEALMLYILAAQILGPRPQIVPSKGTTLPQNYRQLRDHLREFGTVLRDIEADLPFDLVPPSGGSDSGFDQRANLSSLGQTLYFGLPRHEKLIGYWDTVADRLFKIRNSLNLQGAYRQLALFAPPIDPAVLAAATAAGVDIRTAINGLNQPLPLVRFSLLVRMAGELASEVRSLGNNLLSIMEREDAEALALLRAKHERTVLEMAEQVRYAQLQEAIKSREGLLQSLGLAVQRYTYYELQLGRQQDEIARSIAAPETLDRASLARMSFVGEEPTLAQREIAVDIDQQLSGEVGHIVSRHEAEEMRKLRRARDYTDVARLAMLIAPTTAPMPDIEAKIAWMGIGAGFTTGGAKIAQAAKFVADVAMVYADRLNYEAGNAGRIGTYARREQEWAFQSNLAAGEITQIYKQLRAAELREAVAELELKQHRRQMEQAEEVRRFLNEEGLAQNGKQTNKALYVYLRREVRALYEQCFGLAFDVARKAERALQRELGDPSLRYLKPGYQPGKEGLLLGEQLAMDIRRMEAAYHDLNARELELTKHVSLLQVDPLALVQLRATGRCEVNLPEALFDMDGPGHYFRRIKTVALSIPCVTGPYASVNCTLSLQRSIIRINSLLKNKEEYRRTDNDDRFDDYAGFTQAIVTSAAQGDSGLFETNLRDERYLPFELAGAVSEWELRLPANPAEDEPQQFDYATISDVILHMRYTARDGGEALRRAAKGSLTEYIKGEQEQKPVRLFSVRQEFPTEWASFTGSKADAAGLHALTLNLREEHYPFWSKGRVTSVEQLTVLAQADGAVTVHSGAGDTTLSKSGDYGELRYGVIAGITNPIGALPLGFSTAALDDLWLAVQWKG